MVRVCLGVLSHFSHVQLCVTPWTVACQAPLSMGFSRQEYWSGLPFPSRAVPHPGIEPGSLMLPALAGRFFTACTTWEAHVVAGVNGTAWRCTLPSLSNPSVAAPLGDGVEWVVNTLPLCIFFFSWHLVHG